ERGAAAGTTSGEVRLRARRVDRVRDPQAHRRVDGELAEPVHLLPDDLAGLRRGAGDAARERAPHADRELGTHLTVRVHDDVAGVGVDPDETRDAHAVPGLLLRLPHTGLTHGLAGVDAAAGQGPQVVVGAVDEQEP